MKQLKKIMLVCLAMILTMAFVAIPAQAAVAEDTVAPCWDNTAIINITLSFPEEGIGCADAFIAGQPGTTKIEASVYIYRKSGLIWKYVDEEHTTINAITGALNCTFNATIGTYYKAEYTFTVTKNGTNETITKTQYRTYE
jgi:hypothetical protein